MTDAIVLSSSKPATAGKDVCAVRAWGTVCVPHTEIRAMRRSPDPDGYLTCAANFLKHADEQTVAGVAAVARAVHQFRLHDVDFTDWGVIAAPRFPGRRGVALAFTRFAQSGGVTVTPHIVSQLSLHSLSGALSVALGIQGPNFGVGGGPEALSDGLQAALATSDLVPQSWLVLTQWDPEPVPDEKGQITNEATCHAVALALTQTAVESGGLYFHLSCGRPAADRGTADIEQSARPAASVTTLIDFLQGPRGAEGDWVCPLDWSRPAGRDVTNRAA